jgi:hypothetical protein
MEALHIYINLFFYFNFYFSLLWMPKLKAEGYFFIFI